MWNRDRETSSLTPISRSRVRVADCDTSDDNISLDDCLSLNYQPVHGVPGFEIETADDTFWGLIAHYTWARVRLKSTAGLHLQKWTRAAK